MAEVVGMEKVDCFPIGLTKAMHLSADRMCRSARNLIENGAGDDFRDALARQMHMLDEAIKLSHEVFDKIELKADLCKMLRYAQEDIFKIDLGTDKGKQQLATMAGYVTFMTHTVDIMGERALLKLRGNTDGFMPENAIGLQAIYDQFALAYN